MFLSRSGPVSKQELREVPLNFDAAFVIRRTLPEFWGFITGWCGRYHIRNGGKYRKVTGIT